MGCYLSQVRFSRGPKLYWFRSDGCPVCNSQCLAWARGRQTQGQVVKCCYVQDENEAQRVAHIPLSRIAPLISYTAAQHSDSALVLIEHIRVDPRFYAHLPHPEKLMEKYQKIVFEGIELPLVVERSTSLLKDGFAAYLIYTMMRRDHVPVVYVTSIEK